MAMPERSMTAAAEDDPMRPEALRRRYGRARSQCGSWEALWQD